MIYTISDVDLSLVEKKKYLEKLFEVSLDEVFVNILSKDEFSKLNKPLWVVGFSFPRENMVFVIEQAHSGRSYEEWFKVIVHEMVHLYYYKKFQTAQPRWFFEGLACYLANQKKKDSKIELKDLIRFFSEDNTNTEVYTKGYNIIKKILE